MNNTETNDALTTPEYWDNSRPVVPPNLAPNRSLEPYIKDILPHNPEWTCLEVGAVPGGFLLWFALEFGYQPTALDFSSQIQELREPFEARGISLRLEQHDFLSFPETECFDVVFSGGFLEHFQNHAEIVEKHWGLLKPGGYLVLTIPAWSPYQRWVRAFLYTQDKMDSIKSTHLVEYMNLDSLLKDVHLLSELDLLCARYVNRFKTYIRSNTPGLRTSRKWILPLLHKIEWIGNRTKLSNSLMSPTCLVVGQKKDWHHDS